MFQIIANIEMEEEKNTDNDLKGISDINFSKTSSLPPTSDSFGQRILNPVTDPRLSQPNYLPLTNELGKVKKAVNLPFYIEILQYNLPKEIPNKSSLEKGILIQITENFYSFIINGQKGENICNRNQNRIKFGREGDVNFEGRDKSISRNQFEIFLGEESTKIICYCPPPKLPTSFLITYEPFYIEKNNVNIKKKFYI